MTEKLERGFSMSYKTVWLFILFFYASVTVNSTLFCLMVYFCLKKLLVVGYFVYQLSEIVRQIVFFNLH